MADDHAEWSVLWESKMGLFMGAIGGAVRGAQDLVLQERAEELSELENLFVECVHGNGKVVVISSPVGCGKTALLHALGDRVIKHDALFLGAMASRTERALYLGVVSELFRGIELLPESAERVRRLLDGDTVAEAYREGGFEPEITGQVIAAVFHGLFTVLRDLAERRPILIGIDDVHYADPASLQFLLYLVRRLGSARILVVLNECIQPDRAHPLFYAELFHLPQCRCIRLRPLSEHGVEGMLAGRRRAEAAGRAAEYHALSGGNPLLVHSLLEDARASGAVAFPAPAELIVGDNFGNAVLSCLYRCEPMILSLARAIAVLDHEVSPAVLGKLVGLNTEAVVRAVDVLNTAGLLDTGRFRHAAARAAVLGNMPPEGRQALHGRAARLLHSEGAAPMVVAGHIMVADRVEAPWMIPVLREAAEHALFDDEVNLGIVFLRLAYDACTNERQRATTMAALARAEWRVDPAAVARRLPELASAVREGYLEGRDAIATIAYFLWCGRADEAADTLGHVSDEPAPPAAETAAELEAARRWMSISYPDLYKRVMADRPPPAAAKFATANDELRAVSGLAAALGGVAGDDTLTGAEQVLQRSRLGGTSPASIVAALATLVFTDRVERAAFWCDSLLEDVSVRRDTTWRAVPVAVRAMISLRQGNLTAAAARARDALSTLRPTSWGVVLGEPLGSMLLAAVAMGKYDDAATYLCLPVPGAMFQTPCALTYLRARGVYNYATERFHAALSDFYACGEMMLRWGLDRPTFIPWRTDAAQACLELGKIDEARELVHEQLAVLGPGEVRARGISLRVQAMTDGPDGRLALLTQAVEAQQASGDRYELARALADLSRAQRAAGEQGEAQLTARRAHHLARQCGAEPLMRGLLRDGTDQAADMPAGPAAESISLAELSDAERRVAELAARGQTNRQIADTLRITVSTVEQHLTRVYRKLGVNRRTDLSRGLRRDNAS
jgi:DNA-binding CsgD family transcriptional regulator